MSPEFWSGKTVFLTGHTGFKGAWLSILLDRLGARVHGYALAPETEPSLFALAGVDQMLISTIADVTDFCSLKAAIDAASPDIIIHMAAQAFVRRSYDDPLHTIATNVMGTANVLEAARGLPSLKVLLNVTTDKCYENNEWVWGYRETEPLGGKDVYSSSKACSELITQAYRSSFFHNSDVAIGTARAGNVIGGGDWSRDRLVPDVLRALETGATLVVRNPNATRPWQHVLEPLSGYLRLIEKMWQEPGLAGAYNFGPASSDDRQVAWVIDKLFSHWGGDRSWDLDTGYNPPEAHHLRLDSSKAAAMLEWTPRTNTDEALRLVAEWHRAYLDKQDMRAFTVQQIEAYQQAAAA